MISSLLSGCLARNHVSDINEVDQSMSLRRIRLSLQLVIPMTNRSIRTRYQGSFLGLAWLFFNPLIMLIIYSFVFGVIFGARWRSDVDSQAEFAIILFSGLLIYNVFMESANQSTTLIQSNSNLVKKVVFPLELLSVICVLTALFNGFIAFNVWLVAHFIFIGLPPATILYVPLVIIPLWLFCLGISWYLAALGTYLRDLGNIVALLTTAMLFLSPIFYPIEALPPEYRFLIFFNPLTPIIEEFRNLAYFGVGIDWSRWLISLIMSGFVYSTGWYLFVKTKKGFADVL